MPADLTEKTPPEGLGPVYTELAIYFGFVPRLFLAQASVPRLITAEVQLFDAILFRETALSRLQKERIFLISAAVSTNSYCSALFSGRLRGLGMSDSQIELLSARNYREAGLTPAESSLMDFSARLCAEPVRIGRTDIDELRRAGWQDEAILDGVLTSALAGMSCTVAFGLSPAPDFDQEMVPSPSASRALYAAAGGSSAYRAAEQTGPYLRTPELPAHDFAPFAFFEERLGVVPNLFLAQTLRPDAIEAEAVAADLIVAQEEVLPQWKKECILLVSAAAELNTYCAAAHCAMLRRLGLPPDEADQIAIDHHQARLTGADKVLLDFALELTRQPSEIGHKDLGHLRQAGFNHEQILESAVATGFGSFLNILVAGLGVVPDFEPGFTLHRDSRFELRATRGVSRIPGEEAVAMADPDVAFVERVQAGDIEAFGELVRRHEQRVYRAMIGLLRDSGMAQDATQDAFLKAFQHIGEFQGRSRFSTWLMTISRNTALQILRDRKETESLDSESSEEEGFQPRQIRAWEDNPEELYSKTEARRLVEEEILKLPTKLRTVIILRDIEQLPAGEVAAGLGLTIPAVKARLFRARLILREALAPRFAASGEGAGI